MFSNLQSQTQIQTSKENNFSSLECCLALYLQCLLLLKSKKITDSKKKLKDVLIQIKKLIPLFSYSVNPFYFRCTLLCADILLSKNKFDSAQELINKCIEIDQSYIISKEYQLLYLKQIQSKCYTETFDKILKEINYSEPNLSYRLAQLYLKDGNHLQAYNLSKKTLKLFPTFKEIKNKVLIPSSQELSNIL